jgi:hypothetical protein
MNHPRFTTLLLVASFWMPPGQCHADPPAHWAFQPPRAVEPPAVRNARWVRTPVDAFILVRIEAAGLEPAPAVDKATLLRRVTFDLTGLLPTAEELQNFLADDRPEAFEKVVDRLLASPHYGERWTQHWLDLVGYAESDGYEHNGDRPYAWRYRDYVVFALNDDKPYDRFLTEQLAGDELARGRTPREAADLWIATGFNRCRPVHLPGGNFDKEVVRQEVLTEMTNGVSATFLGLTLGCARCHNHKFDPITQADYYRLQAFFAATQYQDVDLATTKEQEVIDEQKKQIERQLEPLKAQLKALEGPYNQRLRQAKLALLEAPFREAVEVDKSKRTPEQKKRAEQAEILLKVSWDELVNALNPADRQRRAEWRKTVHDLEARLPPLNKAWAIATVGDRPPVHVLQRGDVKRKGAVVQPGFPRVLTPVVAEDEDPQGGRSRLALARWLTRADHPLTARVLVNRLWQHHFGRGIVSTPNDFGLRGQPPTHPELLDWLALDFVHHGWSLKHIHRLMVLSNTYRQTSRLASDSATRKADPDNRLFSRMNRHRMEGEALRDCVLAVSGQLNRQVGGPSVRVPLEPAVYELIFTEGEPDDLWPVTPDARQHSRRSLYLFAKRNVRLPLLEAFDQPDSLTSCPVRPVSTFAPQALVLLNGPFMQGQASAFAQRLRRERPDDPRAQVELAYRLALCRSPKEAERQLCADFLAEKGTLEDFCLALLNANEFLYVN